MTLAAEWNCGAASDTAHAQHRQDGEQRRLARTVHGGGPSAWRCGLGDVAGGHGVTRRTASAQVKWCRERRVMAGLDPAIHATTAGVGGAPAERLPDTAAAVPREIEFDFARDGRIKSAHDG